MALAEVAPAKVKAQPAPRFTVRYFLRLSLWWGVAVVYGPLAVLLGLLFGIIKGAGEGVALTVGQAKADLSRWYRMTER